MSDKRYHRVLYVRNVQSRLTKHVRNVNMRYKMYEPRHEVSNNVVCATSKASDLPAHTSSPIRAFASRLNIL